MATSRKERTLSTDQHEAGAEIGPQADAPGLDDYGAGADFRADPPEVGRELLPAVRDDASGEPGLMPARVVYADITTSREGERRQIIPARLRRENIRATAGSQAGVFWHRVRYHALRSPLYLVAVLVWAVVGAVRLAGRQVGWWWTLESHELRSKAVASGDSREYLRLHKEAKSDRKTRGIVLALEVAAMAIGAAVLARPGPMWPKVLAAAAAVLLLARAGRPAGHRIISQAVVPAQYEPPTHEIITRALGALNISQINAALRPDKDGKAAGIRFVSDVMRDGPGWACHLDLPHGVSASDIIARREALASGLRRPLSATWPAGVPEEHPGRLDLWVGFTDISKSKPAACPLVKARQTDVFGSIPFGVDPRMRPIAVPMFEVNWLIGASPGQGKTAAVRVIACGAALDPLADIWIHELAGKGDLDPLAKVCHRYTSGLDDESIAYSP